MEVPQSSEKFYLAYLQGRVEKRTEKPTDTPSWVGPYTLEEIWLRLVPWWNPLNLPDIQSKEGEHSASHGLRPIDFAAKYDEASRSIILFDFSGYVGTVRSPQSLWDALRFQAEHGVGSLRALTRVPDFPAKSNDWKAVADAMAASKRELAAKQKQEAPKPGAISLSDLGLE